MVELQTLECVDTVIARMIFVIIHFLEFIPLGTAILICLCSKKQSRPLISKTTSSDGYIQADEEQQDSYYQGQKRFAAKGNPKYATLLMIDSENLSHNSVWQSTEETEDPVPRAIEPRPCDVDKIAEIQDGKRVNKRDPDYKTIMIRSDWSDRGENTEEYKKRKKREKKKKLFLEGKIKAPTKKNKNYIRLRSTQGSNISETEADKETGRKLTKTDINQIPSFYH